MVKVAYPVPTLYLSCIQSKSDQLNEPTLDQPAYPRPLLLIRPGFQQPQLLTQASVRHMATTVGTVVKGCIFWYRIVPLPSRLSPTCILPLHFSNFSPSNFMHFSSPLQPNHPISNFNCFFYFFSPTLEYNQLTLHLTEPTLYPDTSKSSLPYSKNQTYYM